MPTRMPVKLPGPTSTRICGARPPSTSSAIIGTNRSACPRPTTAWRESITRPPSISATEQAAVAVSMTSVRGRSGETIELLERRAGRAREDRRRIAVAERRDEIGAHGRLVGEERRLDLLGVEPRHRPGIEPERTRGEDEIAALQRRIAERAFVAQRLIADEPRARIGMREQF